MSVTVKVSLQSLNSALNVLRSVSLGLTTPSTQTVAMDQIIVDKSGSVTIEAANWDTRQGVTLPGAIAGATDGGPLAYGVPVNIRAWYKQMRTVCPKTIKGDAWAELTLTGNMHGGSVTLTTTQGSVAHDIGEKASYYLVPDPRNSRLGDEVAIARLTMGDVDLIDSVAVAAGSDPLKPQTHAVNLHRAGELLRVYATDTFRVHRGTIDIGTEASVEVDICPAVVPLRQGITLLRKFDDGGDVRASYLPDMTDPRHGTLILVTDAVRVNIPTLDMGGSPFDVRKASEAILDRRGPGSPVDWYPGVLLPVADAMDAFDEASKIARGCGLNVTIDADASTLTFHFDDRDATEADTRDWQYRYVCGGADLIGSGEVSAWQPQWLADALAGVSDDCATISFSVAPNHGVMRYFTIQGSDFEAFIAGMKVSAAQVAEAPQVRQPQPEPAQPVKGVAPDRPTAGSPTGKARQSKSPMGRARATRKSKGRKP